MILDKPNRQTPTNSGTEVLTTICKLSNYVVAFI